MSQAMGVGTGGRAGVVRDLRRILDDVAERFGSPARETIRDENFDKHVEELELILERLPDEGTVLDVGGGLGVNLLCLRELRPHATLELVEKFDEYTEDNRMGSAQIGLQLMRDAQVRIHQVDLWPDGKLPVPPESVHVATIFNVIEHLPGHPLRQLREMARTLVPGGALLLGGPNATSLMKRVKLLGGRHPYIDFGAWTGNDYHGHVREYTGREYAALLEQCGLEVERIVHSCATPRTRARNRYHRGHHGRLSPVTAALKAMALAETLIPPLRHTAYVVARKR